MKEKKNEEVKVEKVITRENETKIFTKERIISAVIGIFIGVIITSGTFCLCMKKHYPRTSDNGRMQMKDGNRPNVPEMYEKPNKPQRKMPNIDSDKDNQKIDESSDGSTQSSN